MKISSISNGMLRSHNTNQGVSFEATVAFDNGSKAILNKPYMKDAKKGFNDFASYANYHLNQNEGSVIYVNSVDIRNDIVKLSTINQDGQYICTNWNINAYATAENILNNLKNTVRECFAHLTKDDYGNPIN